MKKHTGRKHAPNIYSNVKYIRKSNTDKRKEKKNNVFEMFTFEITHGVNDIETEKGNKTNLRPIEIETNGERECV